MLLIGRRQRRRKARCPGPAQPAPGVLQPQDTGLVIQFDSAAERRLQDGEVGQFPRELDHNFALRFVKTTGPAGDFVLLHHIHSECAEI